jgi:predicted enzyme related to lactoylglutathione lyase
MNDPIGRIEAVVVDCRDPATLARFWATMLGVEPLVRDATWANVPEPAGGTVLAFQQVPEPKAGKNRLHLDVHVADIAVATARCTELGATVRGRVVTDEQGRFQVMADPEGNEFCLVT